MILNMATVISGILELIVAKTNIATLVDGEYRLAVNFFGTWDVRVLKDKDQLTLTHIEVPECSTSTRRPVASTGR